jgi:hypothetical protein
VETLDYHHTMNMRLLRAFVERGGSKLGFGK